MKDVFVNRRMEAEFLKEPDSWECHMAYSPMRQSVLNWYDFRQGASLLEINPGEGALTGLFCNRVSSVTVLAEDEKHQAQLQRRYAVWRASDYRTLPELCVADPSGTLGLQESLEGSYDYLVAYGALEQAADPVGTVKAWLQLLKEDGILLLTAENRYGVSAFLGARGEGQRLPYDGISGYPSETGGRKQFSRQELLRILDQAGAIQRKFYYPIPDGRMPQMVYTDDYHNGLNCTERLLDYHYRGRELLGLEHRVFREMIEDGAIGFMANTFLMEVTKKGMLSDISYAVMTTDRGPLRGMATTIRKDGTVRKQPLWPEGEAQLRQLHNFTEELAAHGVPILRTELQQKETGLCLTMPYISAPGLSAVLKRMAEKGQRDQILSVFDQIRTSIQTASAPVDPSDPEILEHCYLDLAPCNAFYLEEEKRILFYDQEFMADHTSWKFAMYRTLKYAWQSIPDLEAVVPLCAMQELYGISEADLPDFEKQEAAFIASVRNTDQYQKLFVWSTPDKEDMERLCRKLAQEQKAEKKPYRVGYVPGVFDLFHTGHLILLERCKARCDYLIVGVLTDELVEYYKGHRTVIDYENRARVIEALKVVDEVIPVDFANTDKLDAWEQLHYDCHFSGDDHINHWNDVWEELKKRGSNMEFFSYTQGISSTQIRNKLKP